jgi:tetratricopeptide (TPR) repeat protein
MLRVSVRLIEGISGVDYDRRQFEVPSNELLQAQDSLVSQVSWLLRERLGEEVRLRRRRAETSSVEAWALVQRGEQARKEAEAFLRTGDGDGVFNALGRADSLFALAEELDPRWAEPPTLRGWVAYRESRLASDPESILDGIERGLAHAEAALALDPNAAKALELRGTVRYWHTFLGVITDPEEAEAVFQSARADLEAAVDADPSLASAYSTLSHLYYRTGDLTESSLAAQRAYEADAYLDLAHEILWRLFTTSFDAGRLGQARTWCDEGRRRFPDNYRFSECKLLELTIPSVPPDVDAAWRFARETVEAAPEASKSLEERLALIRVAEVLAKAELTDSAKAVLAQARAGAEADQSSDLVFTEARAQTVLGNHERAIDLLKQLLTGYTFEDEDQAEQWAGHWYWRDLRGNPDFERLVRVGR